MYRNIDESDVPELQPAHFEGVPHAEVDFVIHHTRLCVIISRTMRERWALRAPAETRINATKRADEALARLTLQLPTSLQLSVPNLNIWQATLHLTYNNFIILLHRPPPKSNTQDEASEACNDPSLCGGAVAVTTSIFETLLQQDSFSRLWLYGTHALFASIIHVGNELGSANPLAAVKSQRMFETLTAALRELSKYWRFAQGLLQLIEKRSERVKQKNAAQSFDEASTSRRAIENGNDSADFTLRPAPLAQSSTSQYPSTQWGWSSTEPKPVTQVPMNIEMNHSTLSADDALQASLRSSDTDTLARDVSHSQSANSSLFWDQDMSVSRDDSLLDDLPFLDASDLDFFLGELDGNSQSFSLEHAAM